MRTFEDGATMQVAMIVRDLDAALAKHWACGIGPWDIYQFEPGKIENYIYRGKPANHTCLIAVSWSGDTQLELIQPVSGYSIYDEHLERRGEGLHHIKLYCRDLPQAIRDYAARGYPVTQCGKIDEDEHYYLETEKAFGYVIELGNAGKIRAAERRYPA